MPSHDWFDDDTQSRDRSDRRERDYRDYEDRDRGAMFGADRDDRYRDEQRRRRDREPPIGGWGGLMGDDGRERSRYRDEERRYGSDDLNRGIPMDETRKLISSNKVEGTPVYDRHGDDLGSIHNFMVDKVKGKVVYAVLKHGGGFLGLNERYYPLDWDELTYDTRLGGYRVEFDEDDLKSFGSFDSDGRYHRRRSGEESNRARGRDRGRERGYRRDRDMRERW